MCTCITKLHPDAVNTCNDNFEDNKFTGDSIQIEIAKVMTNMLNRKKLAFLVVAATLPLTAYAAEFDIVINKGRVIDAEPRGRGIDTIRLITKDGKIYKNTL